MIKVFNGKVASLYPSAIALQHSAQYNATQKTINLSTHQPPNPLSSYAPKQKKRAGHRPTLFKVSPPGLEPGALPGLWIFKKIVQAGMLYPAELRSISDLNDQSFHWKNGLSISLCDSSPTLRIQRNPSTYQPINL